MTTMDSFRCIKELNVRNEEFFEKIFYYKSLKPGLLNL
ncbi:hypothetical protein EV03_1978 [Prochlorococcus marinus str. PAC1]|uniref:Uncharacterized protein n=1 Tax=Prochlorococcus marinus str. PAC1 TaxID=59924 RepID=A0A0A2BZW2_PROMR|nr:hypothetical protein EV03_1978 [Prochlorococcus marinus str. PAC1]